jgi:hypothetical protein
MTLSDILGRDIRVEWHEAVALVREVVERGTDASAIPELHQVELQPWGQVEIRGGSSANDPVQRLGQMLQTLLVRADPPVQLRLLIAQPQESVHAFSEALAFFERPERASILQALYNRASAALPLTGSDVLAATLAALPDGGAADKKRDLHDRPHRSRKLLYAVALVGIVAVIGAGAIYAGRAEGSSPIASDLTGKVAKGVSGVTSAVGSAVSAIGERVGIGGSAGEAAPVEAANPPAPTATASKTKRSGAAAPPTAVPELQRASLSAFDLDALAVPVVQTESVVVVAEPSAEAPAAGPPEPVVYSSSSPGVSAPVGFRPQLPKELPAGVRPEDLTRIELMILTDGTVESVKLLDQPRDIHASMLLSAAKAWQFHPATRDGVPVRYRKTVWVAR